MKPPIPKQRCHRVRSYGGSMYDAKEDLGMEHGWPAAPQDRVKRVAGKLAFKTSEEILAEQIAEEKRLVCDLPDSPMWLCGTLEPSPCSVCGCYADNLCDEPTGGGTCDMLLCDHCAQQIGPDRHLCPLHFPAYAKKRGLRSVSRG